MKLFNRFRKRNELRANPENPNTPLSNPASWLIDLFGGPTNAGVTVNNDTALQYGAVWGCVRVLSESIAQLPLITYKRLDNGKQRINNSIAGLLHDEPNPEMSSFVWRETLQAHLCTHGNAYSWIERNRLGAPVAIWPLLPDRTEALRENGELVYRTDVDGRKITIRKEDVLHIPALGFNGLNGYSPIAYHRESIGLGIAADKFGSKFFSNGAVLTGVLEHPMKLGDDAATLLKKQWSEMYSGSDNAFNTAVLEEGMKYHQLGIPPEDAQFLETRKFQISEIARIFRIPPHMLADLEKATFSNIEQQSLDFVKFTMMPWIRRWEDELNRKLFKRTSNFASFRVDGLLRGDIVSRYSAYSTAIQNGFMNRNEVREKEDLNQEDGLDEFLFPMNMQKESDPADTDEQQQDSISNSELRYYLNRILNKEKASFVRKWAKLSNSSNPAEAFVQWLRTEFKTQHIEYVIDVTGADEEKALNYVEGVIQSMRDYGDNEFKNWGHVMRPRAEAAIREAMQ